MRGRRIRLWRRQDPAWDMIRFSVNIMRGCFGGCSFCSITEHEGRIIQSRSEASILREIEEIRDKVRGLHRHHLGHRRPDRQHVPAGLQGPEDRDGLPPPVLRLPGYLQEPQHRPSAADRALPQGARDPGVKKIHVASGLRYDLAVKSPEYVKELVTHHVGGYLKIAPEHTEAGPLVQDDEAGHGRLRQVQGDVRPVRARGGQENIILIPYFIAAHPGTTDEDMMNLALWLKRNKFRADQVQTFLPSPMSLCRPPCIHTGRTR
jgi:radical SAM superfamily enzyme YgiQ (UPF0313 family)